MSSGSDDRVFIGDFTRKEFRERMEGGLIKAAIVPVSSTEQHQEHLHMAHDHLHANYMAEQIAKAMVPSVVVATPVNIGVSEHHMEVGPGTLSVRPEIFCEYVFDVCDSLVRAGITNILILNGHGGNVKPMMYRIDEYRERLSNIYKHGKKAGAGVNYLGPPDHHSQDSSETGSGPAMPKPGRSDSGNQLINLRFQSYWDVRATSFAALVLAPLWLACVVHSSYTLSLQLYPVACVFVKSPILVSTISCLPAQR